MNMNFKQRPGRPLAYSVLERRRLILAAAEKVFVEQGYGQATMEEVARAAEMSKKTLYQFFSDKETLFSALMQSEEMPVFPEIQDNTERGTPALLRQTLITVTRFILEPRHVALTRLVIAEAPKHPELSTSFYANYIERFKTTLRLRLLELQRAGVKGADSAVAMEEMLMGATIGACHLKALMLCETVSDADIESRVVRALNMLGIAGCERQVPATLDCSGAAASTVVSL